MRRDLPVGPGACRAVRPVLAWCVITLCFLNPSEFGPVGAGAAFWSPVENFYVHYTRCNLRSPKGKLVRSIQKSTSPDFLHWSRHRPMSFGGAGPIPGQDFYTFGTQPYFSSPW